MTGDACNVTRPWTRGAMHPYSLIKIWLVNGCVLACRWDADQGPEQGHGDAGRRVHRRRGSQGGQPRRQQRGAHHTRNLRLPHRYSTYYTFYVHARC